MCLAAVYWARLDCVYFAGTKDDASEAGFDDSFLYAEMSRAIEARRIPMISLMRGDALAAFDEWRRSSRKILY